MILTQHDLPLPTTLARPVVDWEETACLLCGGRHHASIIDASDTTPGGSGLWFAVVQCQDCGLCFTNPRPSLASISQFYPPIYRAHHFPPSGHRQCRRFHLSPPWGRPRKERERLPWHGQGRLLDFGCGNGSFMERMHRQGWQVTGLDTSPCAVDNVRTILGLRALLGSLPSPHLEADSFDVITMWSSLEHVHNPMEVLRETHRLLVPGGQLLVAVPNIDSLPFRWFGSSWFGLDLPRHLTHFAPWTLHLMLERVGFQVGPLRMVRHSDWFHASACRSSCELLAPRWHRLFTFKPLSRWAAWYSYLTSQCDCMIVTAYR